ncbi:MAG: FAD-dependent oxidoreductase [Ornithinimicrobium sp.]
MSPPVVVVGGGIAGLACARHLSEAGVEPRVLDRGRTVGGRMALRSLHGRVVDTGASYFTVSDQRFAVVVDDWQQRGLAHPWTDTFDVVSGAVFTDPKSGGMRWGAPGGLRRLVEDLAAPVVVQRETVQSVHRTPDGLWSVDGAPARAVVLAMPDPQALRLLGPDLDEARARLDVTYEPVLALSAGWAEHAWRHAGADRAGAFDAAFVNDHDTLSWIADDGRRRGDGAPVLVAHSTPAVAERYLERPEDAGPAMLGALTSVMGIDTDPLWTDVHRWTYAKPVGGRQADHWHSGDGLGLCGDAWSGKPRVESAYCSGIAMAQRLLTSGVLDQPSAR